MYTLEPELLIPYHNTNTSAHGSYIWYVELGTGVFLHGLIVYGGLAQFGKKGSCTSDLEEKTGTAQVHCGAYVVYIQLNVQAYTSRWMLYLQGKPHKVGVLYIVEGCILVVGALNSIFTELHIVELYI